jgi:hypothetical protein
MADSYSFGASRKHTNPPAKRYKQGAEVAGNPLGFQAAKTADFRILALIFQGFEHGKGAFPRLARV